MNSSSASVAGKGGRWQLVDGTERCGPLEHTTPKGRAPIDWTGRTGNRGWRQMWIRAVQRRWPDPCEYRMTSAIVWIAGQPGADKVGGEVMHALATTSSIRPEVGDPGADQPDPAIHL